MSSIKWEIDNFDSLTTSMFCPKLLAHKFCIPKEILFCQLFMHPRSKASYSTHTVIGLSIFPTRMCTHYVKFPLSVKYRLSIVDAKGDKRHTRDLTTEFFNHDSVDTQYNLNYNYLTNPANGLLVNGKLIICCEAYPVDNVDSKSPTQQTQDSNLPQDFVGKLADVTLIVDEKDFKAHKFVLAARSPVFCAMFEHAYTKESQENRVEIRDMAVEVFEEMIRFIYTDKVNSLEKLAVELLQAADQYQLGSLKSTCEHYLGASLTIESFASVAVIADMHNAKKLEKHCLDYLTKHAKEVIKTDGWKTLSDSRLTFCFQLLQFVIDKI